MSEMMQYRFIERALLRLHKQELISGSYCSEGSVCLVGAVTVAMMYPQGILHLEDVSPFDANTLCEATPIFGFMENKNEDFGRDDESCERDDYNPNTPALRKARWEHAYKHVCNQLRTMGEEPLKTKKVNGRLVLA